ncbi:malto-oligosyltrehalose synthase [Larsenimonas salina]|uniref:malto-oligosyltrehalose synthase n=1 Tax=Larsenimonas salina TaxID=1295565 RepID=UPI0020735FF3|nr:malto-oligosyltrehalose synthase [Larsenimonas salina]MCM5703866.1 malto-oligosyltrehalose synthase [Larsenimonas salina]
MTDPGTSPRATMRLQFHAGFTLDDAIDQLDYLQGLGISHVYASPIWASRAGSTHGYDGVDPTRIDPELGGEAALLRLVSALRAREMGLVVDIVPNHLAVGGSENVYWLELLRNGRSSRLADMFDVDWQCGDPTLHNRVLVPFLGEPYGEMLEQDALTLSVDEIESEFQFTYFEHVFPLRPEDQPRVLAELGLDGGEDGGLTALLETDESKRRLNEALEAFNTHPDRAQRRHALLEDQHYRLAHWRTANDWLNWRRFFDITELGAVQVQHAWVFELTHGYLFELVERGLVDGVRIDHIDGLADPGGYCAQLRAGLDRAAQGRPLDAPAGPVPIWVEKILEGQEALPDSWPVTGTTGYDAMNVLSVIQHEPAGEAPLTALWNTLSESGAGFHDEVLAARQELMASNLAAEFDRVLQALVRCARARVELRDITPMMLRRALHALATEFDVYRAYGDTDESELWNRVQDKAGVRLAPPDQGVLEYLVAGLSKQSFAEDELWGQARLRFAQLTAPLAAKAVEDTAGYRHAVLFSRNDVGFDGARFADSVEAFHAFNRHTVAHWPETLLTTATHDHKRGEDVRARLAALSEFGEDAVAEFEAYRTAAQALDGGETFHPVDAWFVFQILVGAWPLELGADDAEGLSTFAERVVNWHQKALREGKQRSHWLYPDEAYEARCRDFVNALLCSDAGQLARVRLHAFIESVAAPGALNGLVQVLLKLTMPGIPDTYQGCERWDFSLVDPDNRRPVDFERRRRQEAMPLPTLLGSWRDGRIKQAMIQELLTLRNQQPELFSRGDYDALTVQGALSEHVIAFRRQFEDHRVLVIAPRTTRALLQGMHGLQIDSARWGETRVLLAEHDRGMTFTDLLGGQVVTDDIELSSLLTVMPFAVLVARAGVKGAEEAVDYCEASASNEHY